MSQARVEQPLNQKAIGSTQTKNPLPSKMTANAMAIGTEPTLIELHQMKFLIMDAPREANLHLYIKKMKKHNVTEIVRFCEPTYKTDQVSSAGIGLHEMEYRDGSSPSTELIMAWLKLVDKTFFQSGADPNSCIAVHCVAGLGRAPQMVAIALIEFGNMDPVDTVTYIRSRRRGAINDKQLNYLQDYRKQYKRLGGGGGDAACCVIL